MSDPISQRGQLAPSRTPQIKPTGPRKDSLNETHAIRHPICLLCICASGQSSSLEDEIYFGRSYRSALLERRADSMPHSHLSKNSQ